MPLDPFFAERLRVHRRYLIRKQLDAVRTRLAKPFRRSRRGGDNQSSGDATLARSLAGSDVHAARLRHRRAVEAWDRKELAAVGTPGPDLRTAEHEVSVPGCPSVRVRIYYPESSPAVPVPAWLTFFGGAFRIGGIDYPTTDAANRRRADEARVAMVAVDYSLAPEHRFPVQIEQAHAALVWLHDNAERLGIDPHRIGVAGTSAGGAIAAALTIANRDRTALPIRLQLLEVPVTDLTGRHLDLRAVRALGIPRVVALRELRSVARTYLTHRHDARNPLASPLRATSHEGLPEAIIFTAEYDPLRGDGIAYAARLRADGVRASAVQYMGVTHDTAIFTRVLPAARRWHSDVIAALSRLHDG